MDVQIRCICPPQAGGEPRHAQGDTITLRDPLDFRTTLILRQTVQWLRSTGDPSEAEILAALSEAYLLHCIGAWTLVDEKGRPVSVSRAGVESRLLPHVDEAVLITDAAEGLYTEKVLLPLVVPGLMSSRGGPMVASTSATNGHSPKPQKRSRPSSTGPTPTVVTAPTEWSRDGVSTT